MATTVAGVVTADPVTIEATKTVRDAAELMRAGDIGDVVVVEDGRPVGVRAAGVRTACRRRPPR